jgi:hypothetical protein
MQVFLPYPDTTKSLFCLNKQRLNKQAVEARQLISILEQNNPRAAWYNHPACIMFRDDLPFLINYYNSCLYLGSTVHGIRFSKLTLLENSESRLPSWLGDDRLHQSHRANLWRKAYDDLEGVKKDGSKKRPNPTQYERLLAEGVECPEGFRSIDYFWPGKSSSYRPDRTN